MYYKFMHVAILYAAELTYKTLDFPPGRESSLLLLGEGLPLGIHVPVLAFLLLPMLHALEI